MHVKLDSWGEPVKLGPKEMEFEVHKIGDIPVRLTWFRGKLAGIEHWDLRNTVAYTAIIDPERPWVKHHG